MYTGAQLSQRKGVISVFFIQLCSSCHIALHSSSVIVELLVSGNHYAVCSLPLPAGYGTFFIVSELGEKIQHTR